MTISSINGFGRKLYGKREFEADGSFITTKWLIMAFLPIVPSASMRVRPIGSDSMFNGEFEIIEELPISWHQAISTYIYAYIIIPMAIHYAEKFNWSNSTQLVVAALIAALTFALRFAFRPRN